MRKTKQQIRQWTICGELSCFRQSRGPYNLPLAKTGPREVTLKDKYGAIVEIVVDHKRSFRAVRIVGVIIEEIEK